MSSCILRGSLFAQNRILTKIPTFQVFKCTFPQNCSFVLKMHFWLKNVILRILKQKSSIWHLFLHGLAQNAKTWDFVKNPARRKIISKYFLPPRIFCRFFENFLGTRISAVSRFTTQLQRSREPLGTKLRFGEKACHPVHFRYF